MKSRCTIALVAALSSSACDSDKVPSIIPPDNSSRVTELEGQMAQVRAQISELENQLADAKVSVINLRIKTSSSVLLKLSDSGFTPLKTDVGFLTIEMKAIEPAGSGSRVRIQIGNPTTATILKLRLTGTWGAVDQEGNPKFSEGHPFQVNIGDQIESGAWVNASFTVDGGKPTDIGYVMIEKASIQSMSLTT